ncbi:MAG: arginyl-tRNA synthetase [Thaumarchaeota archaeon CSP1-1]|nr:MAG: arginyl-tRNA synthetase [Thaumarchaeota archaeon CSP1-1]
MTFKILLEEIYLNIQKIIDELDLPQISFVVEPTKLNFGDVTCNVSFLLAKHLKKKPYEVAKIISEKYQPYLGKLIKKVDAHQSGYINFFANYSQLNTIILKASVKDDYGFLDLGKKSRIVIEHTSVNPNKALHIGHVRNIVLGDTVARILRQTNFDVKVLNYIDDSGLQVADIIVGFKYGGFSENPPPGQKFDQYCGDVVYVKTTEKYSSNPDLEETRKKVLQSLEDEKSDIAKFAEKITKKVLSDQLKTCWKLSASYDCLNFESQIIRSGLWKQVFEKMKEMKLTHLEKEGKNANCWVIKGEKNEEDKVLVRSNGTATYIAKDIPYAAWKLGLLPDPFYYTHYATQENGKILWQTTLDKSTESKQDFTADKVLTIIDSRQSRLQKIITNLMSKFKSDEKAYVHLGYESVTLSSTTAKTLGIDTQGKTTQMSGRKGLYVNADSIIDLLEKKTFEETKKRNPELDEKILQQIAHDVAIGTIRYEMIKQDLDKIITFDLSKSMSLEGDTAPYIQYTHARASRILEKAGFVPNFGVSFELLDNEFEIALIKQIGKFDLQIVDAANNFSPKVIARYCYTLAVTFNAFYEHVKVLDDKNKSLINERLCLVSSFKSTIHNALGLLGILSPNMM